MLLAQGFRWVSTKYTGQKTGVPPYNPSGGPELEREPDREVFDSVLEAQAGSQPSTYPSGLIEIPMCPISDLIAFRTAHWKLEYFLKAVKETVQQAIDRGMVFVLLAHPSCLSVHDPRFRTFDLICDLVDQTRRRAKIVSLDEVAKGAMA